MKRFVRTSALLTPTLVLLLTLFAPKNTSATTYYVSTSGSDTNNGTTKTTPWAHVPGMPSATATAGSYKAVAGDTIILKGCDVWFNTGGNFPMEFSHWRIERKSSKNHGRPDLVQHLQLPVGVEPSCI